MHQQALLCQQVQDAIAVASDGQTHESRHESTVVFDVRGTTIRTTAHTLVGHGCSAALADDIHAHLAQGQDAEPIFADCDPKDFMSILDILHYGLDYADSSALARLSYIMAHIGLAPLAGGSSSGAANTLAPSIRPTGGSHLCDGERVRIHAEMRQLLPAILGADRSEAQQAAARHEHLDGLVHPRSADGTWHLTDDGHAYINDESGNLRAFILDAAVCGTPADDEARMWAERRYRHLDGMLAKAAPLRGAPSSGCRSDKGRSLAADPGPVQPSLLIVGSALAVPGIIAVLVLAEMFTRRW
ncbi:BTB/POZ domain protein [Pandoravirus inopinatum]|uniref:BTB/POZ domain protein n=1 Tax=Pandoravirus inopinatum TaxID=1605721 RepID=A0A0B5IXT3_9VIRU|nr:BTB/POZ domain protein [Pandoravirus inopinatum]AJF97608.1 BTB/POZ domain protein [Pandoravirus inopinatum]